MVRDHERHVLAAMVMRTMTLPWEKGSYTADVYDFPLTWKWDPHIYIRCTKYLLLPWGVHLCLSAVIQTLQFSLDMGFYEEAPLELEIQGVCFVVVFFTPVFALFVLGFHQ